MTKHNHTLGIEKAIKLDAKDKKILKELDLNSRQSYSSIGKKIGLPKNVVNYRIKRLIDEGLINLFCTAINRSKLGYMYCRLFLKFQNTDEAVEEEIINFIASKKNIHWVADLDGIFDLGVVILSKSIKELNEIYSDLIHHFDKYILDKELNIATNLYYLRYNYIYDKIDYTINILGPPHIREELNPMDLQIINLIKQNSRYPMKELIKKLNLSPQIIRSRIKKLIKNKIIDGFRIRINHKLLGYHHFHVFLTLMNITKGKEKEIINYLHSLPQILHIIKSLGKWDLEFEPILKSQFELYELMKELKRRFPNNIQKYDSVLVYKVHPINTVKYE